MPFVNKLPAELRKLRDPITRLALVAGLFIAWGSTTGLVFGLALPDIEKERERELSALQAALLAGGPLVATVAGLLGVAYLAARFNRRRLLLVGGLTCSVLVAGVGVARDVWTVILLGLVIGLVAVFDPVTRALLEQRDPLPQRKEDLRTSRINSTFVFGLATLTTAFPFALGLVGRSWAFIALGAVGAVLTVTAYRLLPDDSGDRPVVEAGESLAQVFAHPRSKWAAYAALVNGGAYGVVVAGTMALILAGHGYGSFWLGIFGARQFVSAWTTMRWGPTARIRRMILAANTAMLIPYLLLAASTLYSGTRLALLLLTGVAIDVATNVVWVGVLQRTLEGTPAKSHAIAGRVLGIGGLGTLGVVAYKLWGDWGVIGVGLAFVLIGLALLPAFVRWTSLERQGEARPFVPDDPATTTEGDWLELDFGPDQVAIVHHSVGRSPVRKQFERGYAALIDEDGERLLSISDLLDSLDLRLFGEIRRPAEHKGTFVGRHQVLPTPYFGPEHRAAVRGSKYVSHKVWLTESGSIGIRILTVASHDDGRPREGTRLSVYEPSEDMSDIKEQAVKLLGEWFQMARRAIAKLGIRDRLDRERQHLEVLVLNQAAELGGRPADRKLDLTRLHWDLGIVAGVLLVGLLAAWLNLAVSVTVLGFVALAAAWLAASSVALVRSRVGAARARGRGSAVPSPALWLETATHENRKEMSTVVLAAARAELAHWVAVAALAAVVVPVAALGTLTSDAMRRIDGALGLALAIAAYALVHSHLVNRARELRDSREAATEAWQRLIDASDRPTERPVAFPIHDAIEIHAADPAHTRMVVDAVASPGAHHAEDRLTRLEELIEDGRPRVTARLYAPQPAAART